MPATKTRVRRPKGEARPGTQGRLDGLARSDAQAGAGTATGPGAHSPSAQMRGRLRQIRAAHASAPGLRERLSGADPERAGRAYLEEQLALTERLTATMASAIDVAQLADHVVAELHHTFGVYLAVIQRLDPDGVLRIVASAGPLAEQGGRFLLAEQPVAVGVNGRVARTGEPALVSDTRLDGDYAVRDPATDPQSELAVPIRVDGRTWGVLNLEEVDAAVFDDGDATLVRTVANQLGVALHRIDIYGELEHALVTMLTVLGAAMEARDAYTALHEEAVAELAAEIAAELELDPAARRALRYAALTHDLGKLSIPNEILHKPGPLDETEWAVMRRHTIVGAEMLARIPFFDDVHGMVRGHHERWDGAGYPDGLRAEEIPLGARILCVCDSFNAMTTARPYRAAMTPDAALQELHRCAGTQFDERVVGAMQRVLARG
jgi:putative nucleotidyltransferase with HDIG domain